MRSFIDDGLFYSGETVKDYSAGAALDIVDGGLGEGEADGDGDGVAVDGAEGISHGSEWRAT